MQGIREKTEKRRKEEATTGVETQERRTSANKEAKLLLLNIT